MVSDAELVVSELVTNSIAARCTRAVVRLDLDAVRMEVWVWDDGPGTPTPRTAANHDTSGRGLIIVSALARQWAVEPQPDGTKWVWATAPPASWGRAAGRADVGGSGGDVSAEHPTIVASSIGWDLLGRGPLDVRVGPLFDHLRELSRVDRPKLCLVMTAYGDDRTGLATAYSAFTGSAFRVSHLALFPMPTVDDVEGFLLDQDVVWVGGGSVANLLAVWRTHQLAPALRRCWEAGVVLGGVSAGSLCWHVGGTTDSFGPTLRPVTDGLAFLPYSNGVHYDSEPQRRPLYQRLVADGTLPDGWATDDGVALVYRGTQLHEVVADRPDARAYRVVREADSAREEPIEPRLLR